MEPLTSVGQRSTALNNLAADEKALQRTAQSVDDLLSRINSLRLERKEYEQSKLLGSLLKEVQSIAKKAASIVEESQTHVRSSFTPVEELRVVTESALKPDENISEAVEEGEVAISARYVPVVLVLHTRAIAEEMAEATNDNRTAADFENLIMNNIAEEDFLTMIEGDSESDDAFLNKQIIEATVALHRALVTTAFTEDTLKEAVTDIGEGFVFNRSALEAFLRIYLINVIEVLRSLADKALFFDSMKKVVSISDSSDETDYNKDLSSEQKELVNEALRAAVGAILENLKQRDLNKPGLLRAALDALKNVAAGAQRMFTPEVKEAEQRVQQLKQDIQEGEPTMEELEKLEDAKEDLQDAINEAEDRSNAEPVEGVHNITVENDAQRFRALYSLGTKRNFNAGDQPFYQTYKALTYAAYLLKDSSDVQELMTMKDMRIGNQPDYSKLFDLLTNLAVGFLPRKPSTESYRVKRPGQEVTAQRYVIDIDTRPATINDEGKLVGPTAVKVKQRIGRDTVEEIRGFTALDGFTLSEMYMTYVTSVRAVLDYFLALNLDTERLSPKTRRSIDRFLESQYSFPLPLFDIYAIPKDEFKELQEKAVQGAEDLIPSADDYPKIDRNQHTDVDAAIRFRMYTDASKRTEQSPKNILRVMTLLQSAAPNVWDAIANNSSDLLSLGFSAATIRRLGTNWLTSRLIRLAKKVAPKEKKNSYLTTSEFSKLDDVRPADTLPDTYVLFDPESLNLQVNRSYNSALANDGLQILPSQSHADRKNKKHKKKKKKMDHDKEWKDIRCSMHDAILKQDRPAFIAAMNRATSKINEEVEQGATEEDLGEHIQFLQEEMDLAARFGLGGSDVVKAMKSAASACSRCPACKRKSKRNDR